MRHVIASIVVATASVIAASAQTLYVPASANVEGANQTRWRTDLQIKAQGNNPATFTIELFESRRDNSSPASLDFQIAANESLRLENLIETAFDFTGTAALRITTTDGALLATSRTFNDDPSGTYGQTIPSVEESACLGFGETTTLIQLSRSSDPSSGYRTNIGLVNVTDHQTGIAVDLFRADSTTITALTYRLKPFEYRQINDIFGVAGPSDIEDGYAVVRTTDEDGRFIAYASVVDNGSGDAVFILGSADVPPPLPSAHRLVVFESLLRPG